MHAMYTGVTAAGYTFWSCHLNSSSYAIVNVLVKPNASIDYLEICGALLLAQKSIHLLFSYHRLE